MFLPPQAGRQGPSTYSDLSVQYSLPPTSQVASQAPNTHAADSCKEFCKVFLK